MLMVAFVLVALWVLGAVSSLTLGGGLHIFLLAAFGIVAPRLFWGKAID